MPSKQDRKDYFDSRKELKQVYDKEYRKRPETRLRERKEQLKKYGMTNEDYDSLLAKQNGGCAICKSSSPNTNRIKFSPIDHCHNTGKIRGLLCSKCNRSIGLLNDDINLLQAAIEYLKNNG